MQYPTSVVENLSFPDSVVHLWDFRPSREHFDKPIHVRSMDIRSLKERYSNSTSLTRNNTEASVLRSPSTDSQTLCAEEHRNHKKSPIMSSASVEEDNLMRKLTRGAPTDSSGVQAASERNPNEDEAARKRNQYFEDSFSTREPHNAPRYRVNQDSIVVIEIKTNTRVCFHFLHWDMKLSSIPVLTVKSR